MNSICSNNEKHVFNCAKSDWILLGKPRQVPPLINAAAEQQILFSDFSKCKQGQLTVPPCPRRLQLPW